LGRLETQAHRVRVLFVYLRSEEPVEESAITPTVEPRVAAKAASEGFYMQAAVAEVAMRRWAVREEQEALGAAQARAVAAAEVAETSA
jgi:hypothetical protein